MNPAEVALRDAATRLTPKNLGHLWSMSAVLSAFDYVPRAFTDVGQQPPLFPLLHPMKIVMFTWGILESRSLDYKIKRLSYSDFAIVVNRLNDAAADPDFLQAIGDEPPEARLLRHFSTMANKQVRFQARDLLFRLARTLLLYEELPNLHKADLQGRLGQSYLDIPAVFEELVGLAPRHAVFLGFAILALIRNRVEGPLRRSVDSMAEQSLDSRALRQSRLLRRILQSGEHLESIVKFTASDLRIVEHSKMTLEAINNYLSHVSRDTRTLRTLLDAEPYKHGFVSYRLNPLERFPIALLGRSSPQKYVVPSLPYLDQLATALPHYVLQDSPAYRQRYQTTNGVVQELYVSTLLRSRLPDYTLVEERVYDMPGGEWRGPDWLLLDRRKRRLVLVESKSVRLHARTVADTGLKTLTQDLSSAVSALVRLEEKIGHLSIGLKEYADIQELLTTYLENPPIAVVVVGEAVEMLAEKVELASSMGLLENLRSFPYPYCLMDLQTFEFAVEIAASGQERLSTLLEGYWRDARRTDAPAQRASTADRFGGRSVDSSNLFLSKTVSSLLDTWN